MSDEFILKALAGLSEGISTGLESRRKRQLEEKKLAIEQEDLLARREQRALSLEQGRRRLENQANLETGRTEDRKIRLATLEQRKREAAARAGRIVSMEDTQLSAELRKIEDAINEDEKAMRNLTEDLRYEKDEARRNELIDDIQGIQDSIDTNKESRSILENRRKGKKGAAPSKPKKEIAPPTNLFSEAQDEAGVRNALRRMAEGASEAKKAELAREAAARIKELGR